VRYEVKLVGSEHDYERVRAELRMLSTGLSPLYKPRIVQSIYFDTPEGRAVSENLAGISSRTKLRLRWYGEQNCAVKAQFECKQRESGLGSKETHYLEAPVDIEGRRRATFVRELRGSLPDSVNVCLSGHEPVQWIRYDREYMNSHDQTIRVTMDRKLATFDQRAERALQCQRPTPLPQLLIVELKADEQHRDAIERLLQGVALSPSKCSKFVMASSPDEAPTPSEFW
jgi:hypothetical protein